MFHFFQGLCEPASDRPYYAARPLTVLESRILGALAIDLRKALATCVGH